MTLLSQLEVEDIARGNQRRYSAATDYIALVSVVENNFILLLISITEGVTCEVDVLNKWRASTCEKCPGGKKWCNEDCEWRYGKCSPKGRMSSERKVAKE